MLFRIALVAAAVFTTSPQVPRLSLIMPLQCADDRCRTRYNEGPYTAGMVSSVLDHSLVLNRANSFYQFGISTTDSDGRIVAFNGEVAAGARSTAVDSTMCIRGRITLPQTPPRAGIANTNGCGSGYASYDEHPGYDYVAAIGTPVRAAAAGRVVGTRREPCINTNLKRGCSGTGFVGIDHGDGWITQYGHLSHISVNAGDVVRQGASIGRSGAVGAPGGAHLHFEVLYKSGSTYYVVDPYGWTGSGRDPLYSASAVPPRRLWQ